MSESNSPTITRSEKTQIGKNPQKVEAGKRLAAISKAAKEKKARERFSAERDESHQSGEENEPKESTEDTDLTGIMICAGVVAGLGGLYYMYTKPKADTKPTDQPKADAPKTGSQASKQPNQNAVPEKTTTRPQLDSFDD